ncbi:MAG TPA: phosphoribosylaminoimidazolesuccinocarboxamide synthase [Microbacteriaceae bacterium]|nr:phosphoribosylaminoimidazolesuccinocarboxamide synthase [Microbacteriaceae bacterium]
MTQTALRDWTRVYSGKVRDLYTREDLPGQLLLVATDRVSAYDHILEPAIPGKGALLTRLSRWWFSVLSDVPNHLVPDESPIPAEVADRSMLVRALDMHPVECVVRGYLSGSGWKEYQGTGAICGVALPAGLHDGDRLPEPIFTPAWKAPQGEHDENITFERVIELVGADVAEELRATSISIFRRASTIAEARGVILADTKFEFGADDEHDVILADEVLTSDSSRYWDRAAYDEGRRGVSWDKQGVRDWLSARWDGHGEPPRLADDIVAATAARYAELIERLTSS